MITFLFLDGNCVSIASFYITVISMWLPDLVSIFTAEVWPIIRALKQTKDAVASKYKSALTFPCVKVGVPYTDFKHINQYILST